MWDRPTYLFLAIRCFLLSNIVLAGVTEKAYLEDPLSHISSSADQGLRTLAKHVDRPILYSIPPIHRTLPVNFPIKSKEERERRQDILFYRLSDEIGREGSDGTDVFSRFLKLLKSFGKQSS